MVKTTRPSTRMTPTARGNCPSPIGQARLEAHSLERMRPISPKVPLGSGRFDGPLTPYGASPSYENPSETGRPPELLGPINPIAWYVSSVLAWPAPGPCGPRPEGADRAYCHAVAGSDVTSLMSPPRRVGS